MSKHFSVLITPKDGRKPPKGELIKTSQELIDRFKELQIGDKISIERIL